jgi:hypothetical protein
VDEHDALAHKQDRTHVRGVRKIKGKVLVQIRGYEENEAHRQHHRTASATVGRRL